MLLDKYIEPYSFIISLALGILYIYLTADKPQVIYKWPTPYNVDNITYRDSANQCYKYKVDKTTCPKDKSKIKQYQFGSENSSPN